MFFAGDLKNGGDGAGVIFQNMSNVVCDVLVDKNNTDVVALGKIIEGILDLNQLCVLLDNQKIGSLGRAVANTSQKESGDGVLFG
jgi:hypothetical protein